MCGVLRCLEDGECNVLFGCAACMWVLDGCGVCMGGGCEMFWICERNV